MLIEVKSQKRSDLVAILWDGVTEPAQVLKDRQWKVDGNKTMADRYLGPRDADGSGESWYGAPDKATLFKRLANGWEEGVRRLSEVEVPEVEAKSVRRRRTRGDQGDWVDMQSVYRGDLSRAWTRMSKREVNGPRSVSLVVNLGASAGTTAERLAWRGISALRLCEVLTEAGYSVAIYGTITGSGVEASGKTIDSVQFVSIKDEDQPLDLDRLAALTVMPGWFRTSGFAGIVTTCDHLGRQACYSLGRPNESRVIEALAMIPSAPQRVFLQPLSVLSRETANEWVASAVQQIEADDAAEAGEGEE